MSGCIPLIIASVIHLTMTILSISPSVRRPMMLLPSGSMHELHTNCVDAFGHYVSSSGLFCALADFHPFMVSVRGSDLNSRMGSATWKFILKHVFQRADLVHTVSEQLSRNVALVTEGSVEALTLSQGVDVELFDFRQRDFSFERALRIICTRSLQDVYDPLTVVRGCAKAREAGLDFKLDFAAGGILAESVKQEVDAAGLADCIRFLGGFKNRELPTLRASYDIYRSASLSDGTSISLMEALAAGLYPVISDIPANRSWLDESSASLFKAGDAEQLASMLVELSAKSPFMQKATQSNRALVTGRANRKTSMEQLMYAYESLLNGKR